MGFNSLFFLFAFLPAALLVYVVVPKILKNTVLLLFSLLFFAWGNPAYVPLLILLILFHFLTGLEMEALLNRGSQRQAKLVLAASVVVDVVFLCFFKYFAGSVGSKGLPMPLGVSFFTFSLLSFLFDVYRGKAPAPHNIIDFGMFVSFFPKVSMGPIVRYAEMAPQLENHPFTMQKFGRGSRKFIIGLAKKVLLSNVLGDTFYALSAMDPKTLSAAGAWLCALSYSLMLYFDFSGYSDMAIGLSEMFGFKVEKNFFYPYLSATVSEFWRRWHISLGNWFKEYVYFPMGGSRVAAPRIALNLATVWLLTGIWHGTGANFLFWGAYYGALIIAEKFVFGKLLDKLPSIVGHVLTVFVAVIGWVFFFSPDLGSAFTLLGQMFGAGGFINATAAYYWGSAWRVIVVAVMTCLPVWSTMGRELMAGDRRWYPLSVVLYGVLLVLCVGGMMNDTYSTFLYNQF